MVLPIKKEMFWKKKTKNVEGKEKLTPKKNNLSKHLDENRFLVADDLKPNEFSSMCHGREGNHIFGYTCKSGDFYMIKAIPPSIMAHILWGFKIKPVVHVKEADPITGCLDGVVQTSNCRFLMYTPTTDAGTTWRDNKFLKKDKKVDMI